MSKGSILVTGGAGFIGSIANKKLAEAGYETVVLDNLSHGDRRAVTQGTFIQGDIADTSLLNRIFQEHRFRAVFHFAALIDVGESVLRPMIYYQNNIFGTLNLLKVMAGHGVKQFIFSSSAAVYGIPKDIPVKETTRCEPINPYGETKLKIEEILKELDEQLKFRSCSLRYFNAAGGDHTGKIANYKAKESNLIPVALRTLLNPSKKVTIYGTDYATPDSTCVRDYIHVDDLVDAHLLALDYLEKGGSTAIYNLGNGSGFSVRQVLNAIDKVTGKKLNVVEGERRMGDPPSLIADSSKARKELGWQPKFPDLETIVGDAWKALLAGQQTTSAKA